MQSLFSTPTPYNVNTTCPDGQPEGFGTITPNPVWLNYCANCITPESNYNWPTFEWPDNPLETPLAPTPTSTEVPQYVKNAYTNLSVSMNNGTPYYVPPETLYSVGDTNNTFADKITVNNTLMEKGSHNLAVELYYWVELDGKGPAFAGVLVSWEVEYYCPPSVDGCNLEFSDGSHLYMGPDQHWYYTFVSYPADNGGSGEFYKKFNLLILGGDADAGQDFAVYFRRKDYSTGTQKLLNIKWWRGWYDFENIPTPTPNPSNSTYCSIINGDGSGPGDDDDGELPGIWVGGSSCFTWGGIDTSIFGIDILVPGLQICFQSIEFGSLDLFGITMDLDLIAAAMAGVVLIRLVTRS